MMAGRWSMVGALALGIMLARQKAAAQVAPADQRWVQAAETFVRRLQRGAFDSAAATVSRAVPAGALNADRLRQIWTQLSTAAGTLTTLRAERVTLQDTMHVVDLAAAFERQALTIRVVFMPDTTLGGLWFLPPTPPAWSPPDYADAAAFDEIDVRIGAEPWVLPGTLTLPRGDARVPVVVLVHGSGPHDRDETIGPNRPFKDIAWGLASRGIAVLRYDKRTLVHARRMDKSLRVKAEVVDDALAALAAARSNPRIDSTRVFLAGHSLGGMMAPDIARQDSALAGLILLAAPARHFQDVVRDQMAYVESLPGTDAATRASLEAVLDTLDLLDLHKLPDTTVVMGAPAGYYYDLDRYDPVAVLAAIDIPVLLLQGGRDYQVTHADYSEWTAAFRARPGFKADELPSLNHLFMEGNGPSTPADYGAPGHVSNALIRGIVQWITGLSGG
jgi:dienelactone hydrolase